MLKPTLLSALYIAFLLGIGAVVFQHFQPAPDYKLAFERTYFQLIALLLAWFFWRKA